MCLCSGMCLSIVYGFVNNLMSSTNKLGWKCCGKLVYYMYLICIKKLKKDISERPKKGPESTSNEDHLQN